MTYVSNAEKREALRPGYLRLQDAAKYLSCSPQWLMYLARKGEGPRRFKQGKAVFYAVTDLDAFMQAGEQPRIAAA